MSIIIIVFFLAVISSFKNKIKKTDEYKLHSFPVKVDISEKMSETDCSPSQLILTYEIDGEVIRGSLDSEFRYSRSQIRRLRSRNRETDIYVNMMNKKKFIVPDIYVEDLVLTISILSDVFIITLFGYWFYRTRFFLEHEMHDWLNEKINDFFTYR